MRSVSLAAFAPARRHERTEQRLAAVLAFLAGYVDAFGYFTLQTYVSFMSGNTTESATAIGQGQLGMALPVLLVIAAFVLGSGAGALLAYSGACRVLYLATAGLLLLAMAMVRLDWLDGAIATVTLGMAMGIMNSSLSSVGAQAIGITFVTGTLSKLGAHAALAIRRAPLADASGPWDTHGRRAVLLFGVWASLLGRAIVGAAVAYFRAGTLLFPCAVLVTLAALRRRAG